MPDEGCCAMKEFHAESRNRIALMHKFAAISLANVPIPEIWRKNKKMNNLFLKAKKLLNFNNSTFAA